MKSLTDLVTRSIIILTRPVEQNIPENLTMVSALFSWRPSGLSSLAKALTSALLAASGVG